MLRRNRRAGFSLIELTIVIAIIGVIAAIGIPRFLQSRKLANESQAIGYMKAIYSAQDLYKNEYNTYATSDEDLVAADMIPGRKPPETNRTSGYQYSIANNSNGTWSAQAFPISHGVTGDRWFYIDQTGVLRVSSVGTATVDDQPLD